MQYKIQYNTIQMMLQMLFSKDLTIQNTTMLCCWSDVDDEDDVDDDDDEW